MRTSGTATRMGVKSLPLHSASLDAEIIVVAQLDLVLTPGPVSQAGTRNAGGDDAQLIVPFKAGNSYAILQTDERGLSTWIFPNQVSPQEQVFTLVASSPASGAGSRGVVTKTMRSLVSIISWITDPVVGKAAKALTSQWEQRHRPYELLQVQSDGTCTLPDWKNFGAGPALLLIHGTFSTPTVGFNGWLGKPAFQALMEKYAGRVIALAHPSLSESPQENVDWLIEQLPAHVVGDNVFDIVSHSRGGLLARELSERVEARLKIEKVCLVGTPNRGTPLADIQHWTSFLNAHTSCLKIMPDTSVTVFLEGLLCLVKVIGSGLTQGLPGLAAMEPAHPLLAKASSGSHLIDWYTVGAVFRAPIAGGMLARFKDAAIDRFFSADNDLVVPSEGCHESVLLPVDSLLFTGEQVNHCNYFEAEALHAKLLEWLK